VAAPIPAVVEASVDHAYTDPSSLEATDQMPTPRVQWSIASSMLSQ